MKFTWKNLGFGKYEIEWGYGVYDSRKKMLIKMLIPDLLKSVNYGNLVWGFIYNLSLFIVVLIFLFAIINPIGEFFILSNFKLYYILLPISRTFYNFIKKVFDREKVNDMMSQISKSDMRIYKRINTINQLLK
tara:strand:- start:9420 stop:9818 length:399 start_codon:yes stop_codon:yes gene_type:complete